MTLDELMTDKPIYCSDIEDRWIEVENYNSTSVLYVDIFSRKKFIQI